MTTSWRKSSHSGGGGGSEGDCVEVASLLADQIGLRDSKNPGPKVAITRTAFTSLVNNIKANAFDTPGR